MTPPHPPPTLDDIFALVHHHTGLGSSLYEHTSLQDEGVYGEDLDNLVFAVADRYGVDMTGYLWYFHTGEEGCNPMWWLIRPPNARVQRIPITPALLLESARRKVWAVDYPPHTLPKTRWDNVAAVWVLIGGVALILLASALARILTR